MQYSSERSYDDCTVNVVSFPFIILCRFVDTRIFTTSYTFGFIYQLNSAWQSRQCAYAMHNQRNGQTYKEVKRSGEGTYTARTHEYNIKSAYTPCEVIGM